MQHDLDPINHYPEEIALRPNTIDSYIGQTQIVENLKIFIKAAKLRSECLDHTLLYGPPGLGKTTLANIIANEMNAKITIIIGPALEKPGDLAAILSALTPGEILFIDEIHRLPKNVEEILYSAMEDFKIDIITSSNYETSSLSIDLPPFTLIGATTLPGNLSAPLLDRFFIDLHLEYYSQEELSQIILRSSKVFECEISNDAAHDLAKASRFTPRIANRLLKRISDFALIENNRVIDVDIVNSALKRLKVDSLGLDKIDRLILETIINVYSGGPVGIESIAATIGQQASNLIEVYEPFLLKQGLIVRTPRGRMITKLGADYLDEN